MSSPAVGAEADRDEPAAPSAALRVAGAGAAAGFAVAGALALLAIPGRPTLLAGLWVAQVVLVACWCAVLPPIAAPRATGLALGAGTALAADLLLARSEPELVGALAGTVAVGFVAAVAGQLVWRERRDVTAVLATQVSGLVLVAGAACLVALRHGAQGRDATLTALLALGVGGVGRLAGRALPVAPLAPGSGLAGPFVWAGVGAATGAAVLGSEGALLGAATAAAGAFGDLLASRPGSRAAVLAAVAPLATGGPVAYALGRVLFG